MGKSRRYESEIEEHHPWSPPQMPKNPPPPQRTTESKPTAPVVEPTDQNQQLTCVGCGDSFTFTVRDQQFFAQKGFAPPKRCRTCAAKKREANAARAQNK